VVARRFPGAISRPQRRQQGLGADKSGSFSNLVFFARFLGGGGEIVVMLVDCLSSKVLLHVTGEDGAKDETRLGPDAGSEGGVNMFQRLVLIAAGARVLGSTM